MDGEGSFPRRLGGPHNHQIGALAAHFLEGNTIEFMQYSKQVLPNAMALGEAWMAKGRELASRHRAASQPHSSMAML